MSKMTSDKWEAMTDAEKYEFLSSGKKVLKSVCGIDGSQKVNECDVTKYYWIDVGGVTITNRHKKESDAYKQADETIESWSKEDDSL